MSKQKKVSWDKPLCLRRGITLFPVIDKDNNPRGIVVFGGEYEQFPPMLANSIKIDIDEFGGEVYCRAVVRSFHFRESFALCPNDYADVALFLAQTNEQIARKELEAINAMKVEL